MEAKLTFKYDRQGDILYINKMPAYPEQQSEELGDEVIARLNPKPGKSKTSKYFLLNSAPSKPLFELPVTRTSTTAEQLTEKQTALDHTQSHD